MPNKREMEKYLIFCQLFLGVIQKKATNFGTLGMDGRKLGANPNLMPPTDPNDPMYN